IRQQDKKNKQFFLHRYLLEEKGLLPDGAGLVRKGPGIFRDDHMRSPYEQPTLPFCSMTIFQAVR
ncbi:hypothetical protein, partial [Desulfovibrio sp.]|uniref:hypothetical protein n=1 Tax=Desulfovibrio sp. TaxID=885 RepID=UPI003AB8D9B8